MYLNFRRLRGKLSSEILGDMRTVAAFSSFAALFHVDEIRPLLTRQVKSKCHMRKGCAYNVGWEMMTDGSELCATSASLEDPAELGVNDIIFPLRGSIEGVVVADLGVVGVLPTRDRPRPRLGGGTGPEEMD